MKTRFSNSVFWLGMTVAIINDTAAGIRQEKKKKPPAVNFTAGGYCIRFLLLLADHLLLVDHKSLPPIEASPPGLRQMDLPLE